MKNWLNPRCKAVGLQWWHYITAHVLILAAIVAAFFLGAFTAHHYDAAYFEHRYPSRVLTMKNPGIRAVVPAAPKAYPPAASIRVGTYPAVGDQGTLGSCAGYATAWALSYEWRVTHPGSWLRFNALCMYSYYSDAYNGGQDGGSWPTQDAEFIPQNGIAKFKAVPDVSPQHILNPLPGACFNTSYRAPVSFSTISYGSNAGIGAIDGIKAAINSGLPVEVALPVYPEYDNATNTGGMIDVPQPGEFSRGGHENVILGYDDSKFGGRGGVLIQNQWTKLWGVNGRGWLSYPFVEQYVFSLLVPHMGSMAPKVGKKLPFVPNHAKKHLLPGASRTTSVGRVKTNAWYVRGIYLRDTGENVSGLYNYWGDRYRIAPYGLAAVGGTESGWRAVADRYGVWPDVSFGLMQFTVATASGYGVCFSTASCRAWLDNPSNSIALAARYLSEARAATGVDFPWLYVAFNAGSGYGFGAAIYTNPCAYNSVACQNFYNNWLPNYNYVLNNYLGGGPTPPPPPPKPRKHYTWPQSIRHAHPWLGRLRHSSWTPRRRAGFDTYRYQHGRAYAWPRYRRYKVTHRR